MAAECICKYSTIYVYTSYGGKSHPPNTFCIFYPPPLLLLSARNFSHYTHAGFLRFSRKMRPIVVAALFAAASNGQFLGLFDTVLPGHGPEQSSVTTGHEPRVAIGKRVDSVIMQIKKTPEEDLEKAGKILSLALKQADQLKRYRETVDDIEKQTSSAHTCYDNYQKKGQQALNNPLSIGDCDKSYFQVQSVLGKARTISRERGFPESSWLYDEKLPDVRDGRDSLQDEETKQLQEILQGLSKIAEKAVTIQKQAERLQWPRPSGSTPTSATTGSGRTS